MEMQIKLSKTANKLHVRESSSLQTMKEGQISIQTMCVCSSVAQRIQHVDLVNKEKNGQNVF